MDGFEGFCSSHRTGSLFRADVKKLDGDLFCYDVLMRMDEHYNMTLVTAIRPDGCCAMMVQVGLKELETLEFVQFDRRAAGSDDVCKS